MMLFTIDLSLWYLVCLYVTSNYGDVPYYVEGLFGISMALYLKNVAMANFLDMMH